MTKKQWVKITPERVILNGEPLITTAQGAALLTEIYRSRVNDYPKFFKMDTLSRLGFMAAELVLNQRTSDLQPSQTAVVFANRSASLKNDTDYQQTIQDTENYYPSPSLFVYTLPNIVTGEVAIRHLFRGESSLYVLENESELNRLIPLALWQKEVKQILCGWVECAEKNRFEAHVKLLQIN